MLSTRLRRLAALVLLLLSACGGDSEQPTGPTGPPATEVAQVSVTSPADTVIDVDGVIQLSARAFDSRGGPVSVAGFDWHTSNAVVGSVSANGLLTPHEVGSVAVSASAEGVEGSLRLRIVQADLEGIERLLGDPYTGSLVAHLEQAMGTSVAGAIELSDALSAGNLLDVDAGLTQAITTLEGASLPDDLVLAATLLLMLNHARQLIGF